MAIGGARLNPVIERYVVVTGADVDCGNDVESCPVSELMKRLRVSEHSMWSISHKTVSVNGKELRQHILMKKNSDDDQMTKTSPSAGSLKYTISDLIKRRDDEFKTLLEKGSLTVTDQNDCCGGTECSLNGIAEYAKETRQEMRLGMQHKKQDIGSGLTTHTLLYLNKPKSEATSSLTKKDSTKFEIAKDLEREPDFMANVDELTTKGTLSKKSLDNNECDGGLNCPVILVYGYMKRELKKDVEMTHCSSKHGLQFNNTHTLNMVIEDNESSEGQDKAGTSSENESATKTSD